VRLNEVSRSVSANNNEFSSSITSCADDQIGESLKMLKGSTWCHLFKEVGQIFKGGTSEFREKLLLYSLETDYKYNFVHNEKVRVIVKCIHKKEKGCN